MFEKFWSAGKKCYIYYDERTIGSCDLFTNNRPGNVWFDGSYEGQTCEERISWWSSQVWHRCLKNSGLPYPGTKEVKLRDDAFYMTKWSSEEPTQLPSSAPTQNVDVRLYKQNWACQVLRHVAGPTTPEACADAVLADSRCSTDHFTWSDSSLVGVPCKCVRDCGSTGVWSNVYDTYSMTRGEGRRELNSFDDIPFGFEANSEFKVEGDMSMDFEFSPNPNILMKIVPPFMDVKAGMQFSLQKDIEHDINMNQYELTEKKTLSTTSI